MANSLGHHGPGEVAQARDRKRGREGHVRAPGRVVVAGEKDQAAQVTPARDSQRERDERAPGVADDDGPLDIQALQHAMHKVRLREAVQTRQRGRSVWPKPGRSMAMTR